ncbi:uncharacterized protein [Musca autumnalis]|uniref:uncharacterized protein n=1 Tax=Musca autumnalis TaxID=221902 RepID=UPI003CE76850
MCLYMSVPQWWNLQKFARVLNERINHTIDVTFLFIYFKCLKKCSRAECKRNELNANEWGQCLENKSWEVKSKTKHGHWLQSGNKLVKLHENTTTPYQSSESKVINFNYFPPSPATAAASTNAVTTTTKELPVLPHFYHQQQQQSEKHHHHARHQVCNHEQLLLVTDMKVKTIPPQSPSPPPPPLPQLHI